MKTSDTEQTFFDRQLAQWPEARQRYLDLQQVQTRELRADGVVLRVQWNPARMVSTGAKIDRKTLGERPCFLCRQNRPAEQLSEPLTDEVTGDGYELLVNPFPILSRHFTIPLSGHEPQCIFGHYAMVHQLTRRFPELTVFYNGPRCGASAPDHMHLQAGTCDLLPLRQQWPQLRRTLRPVYALHDVAAPDRPATLSLLTGYVCPAFVIQSIGEAADNRLFASLCATLASFSISFEEPPMNLLAWRDGDQTTTVVFPRRKHRPDCYYAEGDAQLLVSPGALDMAGLLITPRQQDFDRLTPSLATAILRECGVSEFDAQHMADSLQGPSVSVGIVSGRKIRFTLNAPYTIYGGDVSGEQVAEYRDGQILWNGNLHYELSFDPHPSPLTPYPSFTLEDVIIGVNFHWQRQERQTFLGALWLIVDGDRLCAINTLPVEQYLESVISSEMRAEASLELLKAHAVISRSWLLAQIAHSRQRVEADFVPRQQVHPESADGQEKSPTPTSRQGNQILRWYNRDDHALFDVCADDHCQRYQGITRAAHPNVAEAVRATRGEVLVSPSPLHTLQNDRLHAPEEICDTRFSKCCGGVTEEFQYCWDSIRKPYLTSVACPWCNTHDTRIIRQVLNDYDQETADFYEWEETVSGRQVSVWLREKLGVDLGPVTDLIPVERGRSGRIWLLKVVGEKGEVLVGKELEIRRLLSSTHLKSSWFDVEKTHEDGDTTFILHGHGWGHGVGLCQIGAAVMGEQGYRYDQILSHYYQKSTLTTLY